MDKIRDVLVLVYTLPDRLTSLAFFKNIFIVFLLSFEHDI